MAAPAAAAAAGASAAAPAAAAAATHRPPGARGPRWPPAGNTAGATTRPAADGATTTPAARPAADVFRPGTLWVRDGEFVRPVTVRAGLTDAILTEVTGEGLNEGTEVVIGEDQPSAGGAPANTNPFAPSIRRRGPR